jgi:hypothetical protein
MARGSRLLLALVVAGALAACGGGGTTPQPPPVPTPTPVPTATPSPSTTLWVTAGSTLMRLSAYHSEVDVFSLGATGTAAPTRQIRVGQTLGVFPESVAVDDLGNAYMGVSPRLFQVTSPSSSGNGTAGTAFTSTGAADPRGIALDSSRCVYVAAGTAIEVYNGTIAGGYVKVATIPNGSTNSVSGIAFDGSGALYAIDSNSYDATNTAAPTIAIFRGATCGGQTFQSALGGANTQLQLPAQIAFDAAGFIYVTDAGAKAVFVYAPGATGNVAPVRTIAGSNTRFQKPWGVAVDSAGVLHVSDQTANAVFDFPSAATGNVAPSNTLTGPATDGGFNGPLGITVH